jgi:antibiotic biosynthesis monooxygenase (ABM) superfamily enzyme
VVLSVRGLADGQQIVGYPEWFYKVFTGFFPLSVLLNVLMGTHLMAWNVVARTLVITAIATPVMVYVLLPFLTSRMRPWLHQTGRRRVHTYAPSRSRGRPRRRRAR